MPTAQADRTRLPANAGLAIGVILFALALIAVVTIAFSAGNNFTGSTTTIDSVKANIKAQAVLITAKIQECYSHGYTAKQAYCDPNIETSPGVYSRSGCNPIDKTAFYPTSSGNGIAVSAITCPSYSTSSNNLWTGQSPAQLPPAPKGFNDWVYVNAGDSGGRCIRIEPLASNLNDAATKQGLIEASTSYTTQELVYNPNGTSQRYIIWITRPSGTASADCSS